MLLQMILLNKRWTAIVILCCIIIGLWIYSAYLSNKLNTMESKCDSEKQVIIEKHRQSSEKASQDLLEMSEKYEAERLKEKVIYNAEKHEVKEIIRDNIVYRDCKLDGGMQQKLREATTAK